MKKSKKPTWDSLAKVQFEQIDLDKGLPVEAPRSRWTPQARAKARERIMKFKPWLKSTGPRLTQGKDIAKMNALKDGRWSEPCRKRSRYLSMPGDKPLKRVVVKRGKGYGARLYFELGK